MATTMEQHALAAGRAFPWHEVYAPSVEKAIDFYTNALGFGTEAYPMGEMGTYNMLTYNGTAVAGMMSTNDMQMQGVPPHWSVYLNVDDVDARLAKCKEHGATCVVEPMDIPNVGRMTLIADPQGAHIWLFKPSDMG
jgi:uncharacterized protein